MTVQRASDNPFPSILLEEHVDPSTPPSGHWRLFMDTDNTFKKIDDAGTVTSLEAAAGFSDPMTTRGDIIVRNASNVTARLAVGASGRVLTSDGTDVAWTAPAAAATPTLHGARARNTAGSSTITNSGENDVPMTGTDDYDTDAYHFTSDANLTGTVSKTSGSATITGSSTTFTTELTVNQVISIPGTAAEIGVVKTITNNTSLVLWSNMANNASGQTATRKSAYIAIPAGLGGYYQARANVSFQAVGGTTNYIRIDAGGVSGGRNIGLQGFGATQYAQVHAGVVAMVPGDWFQLKALQNTGGSLTLNVNWNMFEAVLVGV